MYSTKYQALQVQEVRLPADDFAKLMESSTLAC